MKNFHGIMIQILLVLSFKKGKFGCLFFVFVGGVLYLNFIFYVAYESHTNWDQNFVSIGIHELQDDEVDR